MVAAPSISPNARRLPACTNSFRCIHHLTLAASLHEGVSRESSRLQRRFLQQQRSVLLLASTPENAAAAYGRPTAETRWMPPEAWISSITSCLPAVDVDSLPAYTELLQECLVLQPGLLVQHPRQAAASLLHLERCLRGSAVWLGPSMVAAALTKHNPDTLALHLASLVQVWLDAGGLPHSFGQLWVEAPHTLLSWDAPALAAHLQQLQQQAPDIPITHLLSSSCSMAAVLLSLPDAQQLQGCVHQAGGYLIITPYLTQISIEDEQDSTSGRNRQVIAIYGSYLPQVESRVSSRSGSSSTADGEIQGTPDTGKAEPRFTGGVYGWQQTAEAAAISQQQQQQQQRHRRQLPTKAGQQSNSSSSSSSSSVTSPTWQGVYGRKQGGHTPPKQLLKQSEDAAISSASQPMLLMQLDVRPTGAGMMPVLILPPTEAL